MRLFQAPWASPAMASITGLRSPKPWLEFVKRILASMIGATASGARSWGSSRNGRRSCRWRPIYVPAVNRAKAFCQTALPLVVSVISCRELGPKASLVKIAERRFSGITLSRMSDSAVMETCGG